MLQELDEAFSDLRSQGPRTMLAFTPPSNINGASNSIRIERYGCRTVVPKRFEIPSLVITI